MSCAASDDVEDDWWASMGVLPDDEDDGWLRSDGPGESGPDSESESPDDEPDRSSWNEWQWILIKINK